MPLYLSRRVIQESFAELASNATTTSTVFVDLLSITLTTGNSNLIIHHSVSGDNATINKNMYTSILVDDVILQAEACNGVHGPNFYGGGSCSLVVPVTDGSHTIKVQWKTDSAGTARIRPVTNPNSDHCSLLVQEVTV